MKLGLWFWRRILSWAVIVVAHATVGAIVALNPGADWLGWVALGLIAEALVVYTFYFSGATVSEWAKLAAAAVPNMSIGLGGVRAGPTPPKPTEPSP